MDVRGKSITSHANDPASGELIIAADLTAKCSPAQIGIRCQGHFFAGDARRHNTLGVLVSLSPPSPAALGTNIAAGPAECGRWWRDHGGRFSRKIGGVYSARGHKCDASDTEQQDSLHESPPSADSEPKITVLGKQRLKSNGSEFWTYAAFLQQDYSSEREATCLGLLGFVLFLMAPVVLSEAGTTMIDSLTAVPVLAAYALLLFRGRLLARCPQRRWPGC